MHNTHRQRCAYIYSLPIYKNVLCGNNRERERRARARQPGRPHTFNGHLHHSFILLGLSRLLRPECHTLREPSPRKNTIKSARTHFRNRKAERRCSRFAFGPTVSGCQWRFPSVESTFIARRRSLSLFHRQTHARGGCSNFTCARGELKSEKVRKQCEIKCRVRFWRTFSAGFA